MSVVSQEGLKDATNEPSSHAGKRKPGFEDNEKLKRQRKMATKVMKQMGRLLKK